MVPLLDLKTQFASIRTDVLEAIARVCDSQQFVLGPEVEHLERTLAARIGVDHAIGVSSGTDAILAALMALDVGPGDEVVTPTYSFFATAGCVWRLGAKPVFVDIDPATFNVVAEAVERAISPRTKAVLPVHLYGQMADMDPLLGVARRHGIALIEDACQAIGALDKGRQAGSLGEVGCFSFFPTKNLGGFGDGGLVTARDAALGARIRLLRGHGATRKYFHDEVGGNFRLDALQAAVLSVKARHLDEWTAGRRRNAERYRHLFEEAAGRGAFALVEAGSIPVAPRGMALPFVRPDAFHVFNQYVIRASDRDALREWLTAHGVGTEIYYPVPFHLQRCFASLGHQRGDFPVAEAAASDSLALPIYPELTEDQQRNVVAEIERFYVQRSAVSGQR
jgi:dTDP-4-amino-4,6-dideoxygalactose transaminase